MRVVMQVAESDYSVYKIRLKSKDVNKYTLRKINNILDSSLHYDYSVESEGGDIVFTVYLDEVTYNKHHKS